MKELLIILALLVAPYFVATAFGHDGVYAGRLGVAFVFFFGAIGHFVKTTEMTMMIPPIIPFRREITLISGLLEIFIGIAILLIPFPLWVGFGVIFFLILVFPLNIYSAINHIPFGGHSIGPRYLLVRAPLQLIIIGWTYHFFIQHQ